MIYSYDITVAFANERRSKLQADAARSHAASRPDKPARPPAAAGLRWLAKALYTTCWPAPWPWPGGGRGADRPSRVNVSARRVVCSPMVAAGSPRACDARCNSDSGAYRATVVDPDELQRFRSGDPEAVRAVYREYGRLVFAVAYKALGSRDLAEEATQQTFVKAWRAAASFDPARELGPWLATIARRTAIDLHRREARRAAVRLDEASRQSSLPDRRGPGLRRVGRAGGDRRAAAARTRGRAAPAPRVADAGGDRRTARRTGRNHQVKVVPRPPAAGRARWATFGGRRMTAEPRNLGRPSAYTWAEVTT